MKCPTCESCEYAQYCGATEIMRKCERHNKKVEQTNEEWLRSATTEQLAEEIYGFVWCCNELWQRLCCSGDGTDKESDLKIVREWLKQPHKE